MPRPNVSDQRKAEILQAAAATFARLGLERARMDDVAAAAGLSKGTLYLYFRSKDALVEALLHALYAPLSAALLVLDGEGPAPARLTRYVDVVLQIFSDMQPLSALVFDAYAMATRHDSARALMAGYLRDYHAALVRVLRDGMAAGDFRVIDADATATLLIAAFDGLMQVAAVDPERVAIRQSGQMTLQFILNAIHSQPQDPS
jgi:AcrR family transcriptional regulator